jgi:membrane protein DedA with SNARE-associated domain
LTQGQFYTDPIRQVLELKDTALHDYFSQFTQWYGGYYGYPILFLGVFLENVGLPVPGETAVLIAGFVASPAGGEHLSLAAVIALTFLAAILGDNLGFWLGQHFARPRLKRSEGYLFLTPERYKWIEGYFARHGLLSVFFARFITGVRVICAMSAGAAGMSWERFFLANAAGALTWATVISLAGYYFGKSWKLLHHWLGWGAWIVLGVIVLVIAVRHLMTRTANPAQ